MLYTLNVYKSVPISYSLMGSELQRYQVLEKGNGTYCTWVSSGLRTGFGQQA